MSQLDNSGEEDLSDYEGNVIPFSGKQVPKTPGRESPKLTLECVDWTVESYAAELDVFRNPYYPEPGQNDSNYQEEQSESNYQQEQSESNYQQELNVDLTTGADGDGGDCDVVSPCASSQESVGSTDSAESLLTNLENLKRSSESIKRALNDPSVVLPKCEQKILESYCRDPAFLFRIHELLRMDFEAYCTLYGIKNSEGFESLLTKFEQKDSTLLLARFGKLFLEKYIEDREQNDDRNQNSDSCNAVETVKVTELFDAAQNEPDTPDSQYAAVVTAARNDGIASLPPVPNFENSNNERLKRKEQSLYFPGEVLEKANDRVVTNKDSRKLQIEKAGQVLFDYIFTDSDILNCNASGKKGKQAFDEAKVRHLNRTLVWLIKRQSQTSVEESGLMTIYEAHVHHIDHIAQNDLRLEPSDESHFKKAVLIEHAYRCREKLKKGVQTYTEELN